MSCRSGAGSAAEAMHNYWMSGVGFPRDGHISNTLSSQGHSYHYHQPATSTRSRPYLAAPVASVNNLYNSYSNRNDLVVGPMNPSMSSRNAEDDTSIHNSSSAVYQHHQYHPDSTRFMHTNQNFPNEYVGMRSNLVGSINMQGSFHPQTNWPATMPYPRSHNHHNSTIMTNGNTDHDGKYGNPSATSEAKPYDPHQHSSVWAFYYDTITCLRWILSHDKKHYSLYFFYVFSLPLLAQTKQSKIVFIAMNFLLCITHNVWRGAVES